MPEDNQPWPVSTTNIPGTDLTSTVPPGRGALCIATQALRTWLLSALSLRDKSHSAIEGPLIKSALMG